MSDNKPLLKKHIGKQSIIVDSSVLENIFNGKNKEKSEDLLKMFIKFENNREESPFDVFTTMNSFFRAIWLCKHDANVQNIQKALSFIHIIPLAGGDFRSKEKTTNELIRFAKLVTGGKISGK